MKRHASVGRKYLTLKIKNKENKNKKKEKPQST